MCHERLAGTRVCFVCFKRGRFKVKAHSASEQVMQRHATLLYFTFALVQLQPVKQCSRRHGPMVVENECIERREHYLTGRSRQNVGEAAEMGRRSR